MKEPETNKDFKEIAIQQLEGLEAMLETGDYPGGEEELLSNVRFALKAIRRIET